MSGRLLLVAAAAAAAVAAGASASASGWSAPVGLSEQLPSCVPAKCIRFPELAMNTRGDAVAGWRRYYGFQMSRPFGFDCSLSLRRRGSWSAPEPAPGGACPAVAIDPSGNVIAVWEAVQGGRSVVLAQVRTRAGTWLRGQRISQPATDARSPRVVAGARGALAVWLSEQAGRFSLDAAIAGSSGRFGGARTIGPASATTTVRLALNARGDALVGFSSFDRGRTSVLAAFRPAGGRWQAAETLGEARLAGAPAVALDARGNALAAWSESTDLRTAFRPAGGHFGRSTLLARQVGAAEVAFDARGAALATWSGGDDQIAFAASRSPGGKWSAPDAISPPGVRVGAMTSALAPTGDAIAVWVRLAFGSGGRMDAMQAAVRPAGGRFGPARDISREGLLGGMPAVATDARGNGVVLWEGIAGIVEAASYAK